MVPLVKHGHHVHINANLDEESVADSSSVFRSELLDQTSSHLLSIVNYIVPGTIPVLLWTV